MRHHRYRPQGDRHAPTASLRVVAVMVVTAIGSTVMVGSVASATAAQEDASRVLRAAREGREAAERNAVVRSGEIVELQNEIEARFAGAADLAQQIEQARFQVRRSAVSAYVNGGSEDRFVELLTGDDLAEISGRATFATTHVLDSADALSEFEVLKQDNDPELIALVEQREALASRLADAQDAVLQSSAVEADAERALAAAAESARVAAEQEAELQRARDAAATTTQKPVAGAAPPAVPTAAAPVTTTPKAVPSPRTAIVPLTELSAPLPDLPPGGPAPEAWAEVRRCESGGNYRAVSSSGRYRGAYQFDVQTWRGVGGVGDPAAALPIEQDARARLLFIRRGARAWPHCGIALLG